MGSDVVQASPFKGSIGRALARSLATVRSRQTAEAGGDRRIRAKRGRKTLFGGGEPEISPIEKGIFPARARCGSDVRGSNRQIPVRAISKGIAGWLPSPGESRVQTEAAICLWLQSPCAEVARRRYFVAPTRSPT